MLASAIGNIANCYMNMKDFAKAKPLVEEARDITAKSLGPEHSDIAHQYLRLGKILVAEGKIGEARAQMQHALKIWTAAFDPDNLLIANAEHDLGVDLEEAAGNHERHRRLHPRDEVSRTAVTAMSSTAPRPTSTSLVRSGRAAITSPHHRCARHSIELFRRGGARADNLRKEAESWSLAHP